MSALSSQFTKSDGKCYRCLPTNDSIDISATMGNNYSSFLDEADCKKLGDGFEFAKQCEYSPEVFFVSVFLFILTFVLATALKYFRRSRFLSTIVSISITFFTTTFFHDSRNTISSFLIFLTSNRFEKISANSALC